MTTMIPVRPPRSWFDDPDLTEPTALTVTPAGQVFGHACAWGVAHIGLPGHRTPPRSSSGYREFLRGQVETDDGSMVDTGPLSSGGGHAGLDGDLTAAISHYDDVSSAVADIAVGEDAHGVWMAGALRPTVTPEQVRTLRASSVSGDWRPMGRGLALCAILAVNVPGFSVPRARLTASGEPVALVAAGVVPRAQDDRAARAQEGAALLASVDYVDVFARVDADQRARDGAAVLASLDAGPAGRSTLLRRAPAVQRHRGR